MPRPGEGFFDPPSGGCTHVPASFENGPAPGLPGADNWTGHAILAQASIDPSKPIKELLPEAPQFFDVGLTMDDDLSKVPEVQLHAPFLRGRNEFQNTANLLARIDHINKINQDGFLKALIAERPDLKGLPFAMGEACRSDAERSEVRE